MLKSLVTDTVTDVVECLPKIFARVCKDINTSWLYMASPLSDFCRFTGPILLQLLQVLTTGFKLISFFAIIVLNNNFIQVLFCAAPALILTFLSHYCYVQMMAN
jgi:hypothetical protein